ncbi:putative transposable element encoded protein [Trachipleistophora hominis]|uniref:Putative transposable element encoded protein n=1 Tax=Trachipleistophora hominis TaxID=72359 RepID=L7JS71_TRAHO|nr:putative transposable element encoded protein [Trachipleistophora hominis]
MRSCQELNICDPREEEFLGVLLRGECHASHDLRVKVTAAAAAYLSVVMRMHAKALRKTAH